MAAKNENEVPVDHSSPLVSSVGQGVRLRSCACVVVQSDLFNQSLIATTVVCLITSNLSRAHAPGNVALKKGDGGLSKPSVVNVSQVLTVDKSELKEHAGKLSADKVHAIRNGLQVLFERA